jgi:hypothetical protein
MSYLSSVLRESHIACRVATAMRHYIRRDAFRTCRKEVDNNQLATCTYCLRQTGSVVNGKGKVYFVNRANRSSKGGGRVL